MTTCCALKRLKGCILLLARDAKTLRLGNDSVLICPKKLPERSYPLQLNAYSSAPIQTLLAKFATLVFLLMPGVAKSQTLNWSSLNRSAIVDRGGEVLNETFIFQLSAFGPDFKPIESNLREWATNWRVFDTADHAYDLSSQTGYPTGAQAMQDVPDYTTMFQGLTADLWIHNAANTDYFLASAAAKPGVAAWQFPLLDPGCCPTGIFSWSISDLGGDTPIWSSQGGNDGGGGFTAPRPFDIRTYRVSEPGAWLLSLVAPLVLLRCRR